VLAVNGGDTKPFGEPRLDAHGGGHGDGCTVADCEGDVVSLAGVAELGRCEGCWRFCKGGNTKGGQQRS
jgi:hypothetical protein